LAEEGNVDMGVLEVMKGSKSWVFQELQAEYPDAEPEAVETALELIEIVAVLNFQKEMLYERFGLTLGRFEILLILRNEPNRALPPSEIAKRMGVTRGTMTQFIDALEKDHLVIREDDPQDRRAMFIKLTSQGESLVQKVLPEHFKRLSRFIRVLTTSERKLLLSLMGKLAQGTKATDTDSIT
jgi:DNA-binding MarR family transcriptional regulator